MLHNFASKTLLDIELEFNSLQDHFEFMALTCSEYHSSIQNIILKHLLSSSYKKYGFHLDSKHSSFSIHYPVNITFTDQAKSLR